MKPFLLVTDLDNTLVGDREALTELMARLLPQRDFGTKLVYSTGRSLASYHLLSLEQSLPTPDALVTGVGTGIYYRECSNDGYCLGRTPDPIWAAQLAEGWHRDRVARVSARFTDLIPQPDMEQGPFKVSYYLCETLAMDVVSELKTALKEEGLGVKLIYSGGKDLDILPYSADKGLAMTFLREQWGFSASQTIACGDSGNDVALFRNREEHGIIVGNARPELLEWHEANPSPYRYLANGLYAWGILEGLTYFKFLN